MTEMRQKTFRTQLERLINSCSMENGSNTPDFVLATFMAECLAAFDKATNRREEWCGRHPNLIGDVPAPEASSPQPIAVTPGSR